MRMRFGVGQNVVGGWKIILEDRPGLEGQRRPKCESKAKLCRSVLMFNIVPTTGN